MNPQERADAIDNSLRGEAADLAESWVNGNRSTTLGALLGDGTDRARLEAVGKAVAMVACHFSHDAAAHFCARLLTHIGAMIEGGRL
jgi:hypothetical protein